MNNKWYLETWFISTNFTLSFLILPFFSGVILLIMKLIQEKKDKLAFKELSEIKEQLEQDYTKLKGQSDLFNLSDISEANQRLIDLNYTVELQSNQSTSLQMDIENLSLQHDSMLKKVTTQTNKLTRSKEIFKSLNYAIDKFFNYIPDDLAIHVPENDLTELEMISPGIMQKLHCMDIKDLKKAYNANDKIINDTLTKYSQRYTTKANKAIYSLMVIALKSELQNVLNNMKYNKLENALESLKSITEKYLKIATDGNKAIAPTMTKFIGEVEYLFISAVKIEYNYYVKKERAKEEQKAIRQQMQEEAKERKLLAQQKAKIEKEEEKYLNEMKNIQDLINNTSDQSQLDSLNARILELQSQLSDVQIQKEEVAKLQNGKAGNVYVISNLGTFGDTTFKVGMTRRLNPDDRIAELSSASVPFKFDVHSMIFSDNAVELEKKLHSILHTKRVNRVNMRKEFFNTTIGELEDLVFDIEPTAEFNKTMLAEEFNQSLSIDLSDDEDGILIYEDEEIDFDNEISNLDEEIIYN